MDRRPRIPWIGRPSARRAPGPVGRVVIALVAAASVVGAVVLVGAPATGGPGRLASATPSAADPTSAPLLAGHEVYGFVPYWEIDDTIAAHLRATDATTIALFSVTNTSKGAIATTLKGYRAIDGPIGREIVTDAHRLGRRVDMTWTSFGRPRNDALFRSEDLQNRVIASLVALRADLDVDGIAVDVEEIGDTDIPAYGGFVGRLRTALRASDPTATVTATTGAGPRGAALAFAASLAGADRIFLMGYDYRTVSSEPGASAPISRGDGVDRSIVWSLDLYAAAGVPAGRTLLGLPLYGLAWPTATPEPGSPKTGRGSVWVPRRNLATLLNPAASASYDPVEVVAFLAVPDGTTWQAIYYDSPRSLRPKLGLANDLGLAGAGFWALGYERGLPDYTALIADFRAGRSMTVGPVTVGPVTP
ncbi:MAG TPA: glycosyl hydrolase family 18 protein [Candidatus Limnocylindrales bacterium]|nr:glycosyl hydrolase family 18 protein [Candidatus Limnocylindrales bacterium]